MKRYICLSMLLLSSATALAESPYHSILPGEMDPSKDAKDTTLLDNRKGCQKGERRFQIYICANTEEKPKCAFPTPVMKCGTKLEKPSCTPPQVAIPKQRCE